MEKKDFYKKVRRPLKKVIREYKKLTDYSGNGELYISLVILKLAEWDRIQIDFHDGKQRNFVCTRDYITLEDEKCK